MSFRSRTSSEHLATIFRLRVAFNFCLYCSNVSSSRRQLLKYSSRWKIEEKSKIFGLSLYLILNNSLKFSYLIVPQQPTSASRAAPLAWRRWSRTCAVWVPAGTARSPRHVVPAARLPPACVFPPAKIESIFVKNWYPKSEAWSWMCKIRG